MTILFAGGEDSDFSTLGGCSVDTTTTAARRVTNARCSLKVSSPGANDGWNAPFAQATSFWTTGRFFANDPGFFSYPVNSFLLLFYDAAGARRLGITVDIVNPFLIQLVKIDTAGALTVLARASVKVTASLLTKVDLFVNYTGAGQANLYFDGTQILSYSGDLTTNSATGLASCTFGQATANGTSLSYSWSEMIVATVDTRALSLFTLAPAGTGNAFAWTGSASDINEVTVSDATLATSSSANEILETTVAGGALSNTSGIVALCVSGRAQKGASGPANANLMVRTAGADHLSTNVALPSTLGRIAAVWDVNPATNRPWAATDITAAAFNIGIKSLT